MFKKTTCIYFKAQKYNFCANIAVFLRQNHIKSFDSAFLFRFLIHCIVFRIFVVHFGSFNNN